MNPMTRSDHLFGALFSDAETDTLWSSDRFLTGFIQFEKALARALGEVRLVSPTVAQEALSDIDGFTPDMRGLRSQVLIDGLPVPEFVRQLKAHARPSSRPAIHTGATSQDLIDTTVSLILKDANALLADYLEAVISKLRSAEREWGNNPLMGRTRMQAALPITVGDRVASWRAPLDGHRERLDALRPRVEILQLGGPVGNRAGFVPHGSKVANLMASDLGLQSSPQAWHSTRENLADYAAWLSAITGSLGKLGQDIALMAQQGIDEVRLSGGGSSSAMPHKQNPVRAETLVALARYNAAQLSLMHAALVHEQERSGAAWTLEWMVLPAMVTTTINALKQAEALLAQIERVG